MKTIPTLLLIASFSVAAGCSDKAKDPEKAREDVAAKARADAAKKEMETLPKVFQSRDIFKKNEPPKPAEAKTAEAAPEKKP